jgi:site-specific recombinase XerD
MFCIMAETRIEPLLQQIVLGATRQVVNAFLIDRKSRQFSPNTITLYTLELSYFCTFLDTIGVISLVEITPDVIRHYLVAQAEHRNPGGCHVSYRVIKTFLRWAWDELELEGRNPITRVEAPKLNVQPLPGIPLSDIQKMIDSCSTLQAPRDKAVLLCLLDTGARASEFVALNIADVDLLTGATVIHHGKGNKRRTVNLGKKARKVLRNYLKTRSDLSPKSPLWMTDEGDRLSQSGLRQVLRRRALAAGLDKEPGAHDFRRAFAISMLRNGCDLITLARLMGHSGLEVLKRYLALIDQDLASAHLKYGPVDNYDF